MTVYDGEIFAVFKPDVISTGDMKGLYKKEHLVDKESLLREEIPLFQSVSSLLDGDLDENIILFCSQHCCLFLEGIEGLFDYERGFDLFKPGKRSGAFSLRHKMDFQLGKGYISVSLGKVEQWKSLAERVKVILSLKDKEKRYATCRELLEEYPITIGIDSRFQATYERCTTPASLIALSLAKLLTGEEKYYKCAECGRYSSAQTMSFSNLFTPDAREYLRLALIGDIWLHHASKGSRFNCYNNIWYRLNTYKKKKQL